MLPKNFVGAAKVISYNTPTQQRLRFTLKDRFPIFKSGDGVRCYCILDGKPQRLDCIITQQLEATTREHYLLLMVSIFLLKTQQKLCTRGIPLKPKYNVAEIYSVKEIAWNFGEGENTKTR